jgi:hypothetical protein
MLRSAAALFSDPEALALAADAAVEAPEPSRVDAAAAVLILSETVPEG